jgi:hypothetical protein
VGLLARTGAGSESVDWAGVGSMALGGMVGDAGVCASAIPLQPETINITALSVDFVMARLLPTGAATACCERIEENRAARREIVSVRDYADLAGGRWAWRSGRKWLASLQKPAQGAPQLFFGARGGVVA